MRDEPQHGPAAVPPEKIRKRMPDPIDKRTTTLDASMRLAFERARIDCRQHANVVVLASTSSFNSNWGASGKKVA